MGRDTADELVGEAFRIAFERRATYDAQRPSARPWLYGIATHLVAKNRRTEARRLRAMARLAGSRPDDSPAEYVASVVDARQRWSLVAQAIADLPDAERDALLLFAWEDLTYEEIAAALEVPVGTVRSRLNRARRRLHELTATSWEQGEQPVTVHLAGIEP